MLGLDRTSFSRSWVSVPSTRPHHSVPTLTRSLTKGRLPCPSSTPSFSVWPLGRPDNPACPLACSALPCLHLLRPPVSAQTRPGNATESEVPGGVAFLVPKPPSPPLRVLGAPAFPPASSLLPPLPRLLFLLSEPFAPVLGLLILFSDLELHPRALLPSLPSSLGLVSSPDTICPTWGISRGRESLLGRPPILAKCTPCAGLGGRGLARTSALPHPRIPVLVTPGGVPVWMWGESSLPQEKPEGGRCCGGGAPPARGLPGVFHTLSQSPATGSPSLVQPGPGSRFLTSCSLLLRNRTGQLPQEERRVLSVPQ